MNKTSTSTGSLLGDICEVVGLSERTHTLFYFLSYKHSEIDHEGYILDIINVLVLTSLTSC